MSSKDVVARLRRTYANLLELEERAAAMPSMGGRQIGPVLRRAVRDAPRDTVVVEVGSWLGGGTAQLALGNLERSDRLEIHCFDRWQATAVEASKAEVRGVSISEGADTLPMVMAALEPFELPIVFHKGDIANANWNGQAISVYVDDAAKSPVLFSRVVSTFGPSWIPGVTILVLMDFNYWEKSDNAKFRCQKEFIERHETHFEFIWRAENSPALFLYKEPLDFISLGESILPRR